jgi:hypothetical protein
MSSYKLSVDNMSLELSPMKDLKTTAIPVQNNKKPPKSFRFRQ